MPRPKRPVILKKDGISKRFDSITEAAAFLGVRTPNVCQVLNVRERHHTIHGYSIEYDGEAVQPKPLVVASLKYSTKYVGLEVEIDGATYVSESKPDKKNCTECDIYKAKPPMSMFGVPLCYEHSIGRRKVVKYCESNLCLVWKRKSETNK